MLHLILCLLLHFFFSFCYSPYTSSTSSSFHSLPSSFDPISPSFPLSPPPSPLCALHLPLPHNTPFHPFTPSSPHSYFPFFSSSSSPSSLSLLDIFLLLLLLLHPDQHLLVILRPAAYHPYITQWGAGRGRA